MQLGKRGISMAIIIGNFHSRQDLAVEMRKTCMPDISSLIALPKIGNRQDPNLPGEDREEEPGSATQCISLPQSQQLPGHSEHGN